MSRAWMPLYVGDFLADTMHLNCQETGAYLRLLMHAWQHDGYVPDDNEKMARIVRCHPPHWPRLRRVMEPFFDMTKTPGSWYSKRIGLELTKAEEISNKRKAAALQMHSKSSANAMQMHPQSQSHTQRKKEDAPNGASAPKVYAFVEGSIRLTEKDFRKWEQAFPNINVRAELLSRIEWASQQRDWYWAMQSALAKINREVGIRIKTEQEGNREPGVRGQ